jgi:hypothetical protein
MPNEKASQNLLNASLMSLLKKEMFDDRQQMRFTSASQIEEFLYYKELRYLSYC